MGEVISMRFYIGKKEVLYIWFAKEIKVFFINIFRFKKYKYVFIVINEIVKRNKNNLKIVLVDIRFFLFLYFRE